MPPVNRQPENPLVELQKKWVEDQDTIVTKSWEHAQSYANIVIFAGYAGTFAVWNFVHDKMPSKLTAIVAILLILSIATFTLFEVYRTYHLSWIWNAQIAARKGRQSHQEAIDALLKLQNRIQEVTKTVFMPVWQITFTITLSLALFAVAILLFVLFAELLTV
jgi:hypothetical protein